MATEASLQGIKVYGNKWRARIRLPIPDDLIGQSMDRVQTYMDMLVFCQNTATPIINALNRIKNRLPKDSIARLEEIIEQMEVSFIWENLESLKDDPELADFADCLDQELLYCLNDLYNWADYYRICIIP